MCVAWPPVMWSEPTKNPGTLKKHGAYLTYPANTGSTEGEYASFVETKRWCSSLQVYPPSGMDYVPTGTFATITLANQRL